MNIIFDFAIGQSRAFLLFVFTLHSLIHNNNNLKVHLCMILKHFEKMSNYTCQINAVVLKVPYFCIWCAEVLGQIQPHFVIFNFWSYVHSMSQIEICDVTLLFWSQKGNVILCFVVVSSTLLSHFVYIPTDGEPKKNLNQKEFSLFRIFIKDFYYTLPFRLGSELKRFFK